MSKALRCDRCGKAFIPFLNKKTDINFCPECTYKFIKHVFMGGFKHEGSYLSGIVSADGDPKCVRGRFKYEGSSSDSDCEASEWPDDPK